MINLNEGFSVALKSPKFKPGQIVSHLKYSYRGLVVESDESCQADETWYQSNQTQPDREQPWYHLLVDGNQQVTYVAQSNLELDLSGEPIVHPMLNLFFCGIDEENNRYLRNNIPFNPGSPPDALPPPPPNEPPPIPPNVS